MILQLISSLLVSCSVGAPLGSTSLPTLERSNAITRDLINGNYDLTLHQGDAYHFSYSLEIGIDKVTFNLLNDNGVNLVRVFNFDCSHSYNVNYFGNDFEYLDFDYIEITTQLNTLNAFESSSLLYCDNVLDEEFSFSILGELLLDEEVTYSFDLVILGDFTCDSSFANYITPIVNPYTPPAKSNLYRLLYDFYYSLFNDDDLTAISTSFNMPFDSWLAHTMTIVTLLTLIVVIFFFLKWLFRVVSGLILLKR